MNLKDEIVVELAKTLKEFMVLSALEWDVAYYRFVATGGRGSRTELVHILGRELRFPSESSRAEFRVEEELIDKYTWILKGLFFKLNEELEKNGVGKPAASVLKVTKSGEYKVDFDYEDRDALQIGKMYLGLPNSYFKPCEIDIPDYIVDFQNELGKVVQKP